MTQPHECIPAIIEPTEEDTIAALDAVSALIESEAENLRAVQRAEGALIAARREGLTPFVVAELRTAFKRLDTRYPELDGAKLTSNELIATANEARDMIGRVSGDHIRLSDGSEDASLEFGFTDRWRLSERTEEEFLARTTCDGCRPNLEEMIRRDKLAGHSKYWARSRCTS